MSLQDQFSKYFSERVDEEEQIDVDYLANYLLHVLQNELEQVNHTTELIILGRNYDFKPSIHAASTSIERYNNPSIEYEPIKGWNWEGIKALGWRVWKAFFENAPNKGYKTRIRPSSVSASYMERTIEFKEYALITSRFHHRLRLAYDPLKDQLYIQDKMHSLSNW